MMSILLAFIIGCAVGAAVAFWLLARDGGGVRLPW